MAVSFRLAAAAARRKSPQALAGYRAAPATFQREQRDQRVLARRIEPGGDQQGAELVAVQRGGMGPVVHPRTADVSGRGMLEELFFDGVLILEPGDGAQPPVTVARTRPLASRSRAKPSMADGEQAQGAGPAPAGELAQVQGVRLPPGLASSVSARTGRYPMTAGRVIFRRG